MGPRYPGGPRPGSVRMPQMGPEFGGVKQNQQKLFFTRDRPITFLLFFLFFFVASRPTDDAQQSGSHSAR
jgi:hypothetical protein